MAERKHPPGPPMTLGNMRELGVRNLVASCLNDACRHTALIDVSGYPAETEVPFFRSRVVWCCHFLFMPAFRVIRN